jgi:hypothetical protein
MHAPITIRPATATPVSVNVADKRLELNLTNTITGTFLARNHRGMAGRAFLARDLVRGEAYLVAPTHVQAAMLARCGLVALRRACVASEAQRSLINAGRLRLCDVDVPDIVDGWLAHPEQREAFVRDRLGEIWRLVEHCTA